MVETKLQPKLIIKYFESFRNTGVATIWAIEIDGTGLWEIAARTTPPHAGFQEAFIPLGE